MAELARAHPKLLALMGVPTCAAARTPGVEFFMEGSIMDEFKLVAWKQRELRDEDLAYNILDPIRGHYGIFGNIYCEYFIQFTRERDPASGMEAAAAWRIAMSHDENHSRPTSKEKATLGGDVAGRWSIAVMKEHWLLGYSVFAEIGPNKYVPVMLDLYAPRTDGNGARQLQLLCVSAWPDVLTNALHFQGRGHCGENGIWSTGSSRNYPGPPAQWATGASSWS